MFEPLLSKLNKMSIRTKLVLIFIATKAFPLVLLAWIAWLAASELADNLGGRIDEMAASMRETVTEIGEGVTADSVAALDEKSRDSIERLTTDTAQSLARFLYDRDSDLLLATSLPIGEESYRAFLKNRFRSVSVHETWALADDGKRWEAISKKENSLNSVSAPLTENAANFHSRPKEHLTTKEQKPLYAEMTFVDPSGQEIIKITTSDMMDPQLQAVAIKENTWLKAESYFERLQNLKENEIDVSRVIGAYVPSSLIGPFTPERAESAGVPFSPEMSAYAGKENPVGQRFKGIVRWSTPVVRDNAIVGYVTLALDHQHIMEFTDHIVPTDERYTEISDAGSGNYAFLWDYEGRNISHPRDYFIVGYDPDTGDLAVPWLSQDVYDAWEKSGLSYSEFQKKAPVYRDQSREKKPSLALRNAGNIALDCRFLDFAPQCTGWRNLTQNGGSGSFVIFWSGLWKLSTAATIPYYTGQYKNSPRGFGWVTIGANVGEFHRPALETKASIDKKIAESDARLTMLNQSLLSLVLDNTKKLMVELSLSTLIMLVIVMLIAVWLATILAKRVSQINSGLSHFHAGDMNKRLTPSSGDEMGQLAESFNAMADRIQEGFHDLEIEVDERRRAEKNLKRAQDELEDRVLLRTQELSASNDRLKDEVIQHGLTEKSRIEAERIKKDAQQRLAEAVEVLPFAFALFDADDKLVLCNREYEKIFSQGRTLPPGEGYKDILFSFVENIPDNEKPENVEEYINARLLRREMPARNSSFQFKPGHWIDVNDYPLENGGLIFVGIDVSERRHLEMQLGHAQKMEAVGQLTGGVAHDFNNILSIIMGNLELIEDELEEDPETLELAKSALRGAARGAEITRKLLRFSSNRVSGSKLISVNDFLFGIEDLLAKLLTASIHLENKLATNVWPVDIDPGDLEDAIVNLSLNARDAMPDGGSLTIETANRTLDENYLESSPTGKTGDWVMISISDTGCGMSEEVKDKVFEPFFTTKHEGQGTGLGLSMVYGFVQRSGGHIDIYSKSDVGTTINIYLPRAKTSKIKDYQEKSDTLSFSENGVLPHGDETLLVVDDELELASVVVATLQQLGYNTMVASSGLAAMELLAEHPEIDLIFSDVIMPGELDGYQLALQAKSTYPDLKFLMTSGFTKQTEATFKEGNEFTSHLVSNLLRKPYNRAELAQAVRIALDEKIPELA